MNKIRAFLAASLLLGSLNAAAVAGNYSDTWWNPAEVGTGVQIQQQGEIAFVTLYVYGSDNEPLWLVATDARVYAYTSSGYPAFRGTLYRTRGSAFSGPHDNVQTQVIPVGTLYLTGTSDNGLDLEYTVNNITVTKKLTRQTFALPLAAANFTGAFTLRMSPNDSSPPYGTREYNADFLFHVNDEGLGVLRVEDAINGLCDYRGPYRQAGRYGSFAGTYTCAAGDNGSFSVAQLEVTETGVTGSLTVTGREGLGRGRFGAVRR